MFWYGPPLICFGHLLDVLGLWVQLASGQIHVYKLELFANAFQLALLMVSCGVARGVGLFVTMFYVFGVLDSYAGFPLHHASKAWTQEGETARLEGTRDLAEHMAAATVESNRVEAGGWTSLFVYELMSNHAIHHIFPTVDASRSELVRPIFETTLKEFGVVEHCMAQPDSYLSMWPSWVMGTFPWPFGITSRHRNARKS